MTWVQERIFADLVGKVIEKVALIAVIISVVLFFILRGYL